LPGGAEPLAGAVAGASTDGKALVALVDAPVASAGLAHARYAPKASKSVRPTIGTLKASATIHARPPECWTTGVAVEKGAGIEIRCPSSGCPHDRQ
jgi:hypothetical protein